jgi:hypothetical protein
MTGKSLPSFSAFVSVAVKLFLKWFPGKLRFSRNTDESLGVLYVVIFVDRFLQYY